MQAKNMRDPIKKLAKLIGQELRDQVRVETRTIMVAGVEHTVEVKICPPAVSMGYGNLDFEKYCWKEYGNTIKPKKTVLPKPKVRRPLQALAKGTANE